MVLLDDGFECRQELYFLFTALDGNHVTVQKCSFDIYVDSQRVHYNELQPVEGVSNADFQPNDLVKHEGTPVCVV